MLLEIGDTVKVVVHDAVSTDRFGKIGVVERVRSNSYGTRYDLYYDVRFKDEPRTVPFGETEVKRLGKNADVVHSR